MSTKHPWQSTARVSVYLTATCLFIFSATVACGQPPVFQEMEKFFDRFAEQAGPLAPMFGKLSEEQLAKLEAIEVSLADERRYGASVLDSYLQSLAREKIEVTRTGADVNYLKQLCNQLIPLMKNGRRYRQLDVRIVEVESSDAYSIPGGHLLFTRGLIDQCGSEAALVGTLGHELSHLDNGHQLLPLKQSQLAGQRLNLADQMLAVSLVARPFRPEQETEADMDATQWMMAAGYDAKELARMLNEWNDKQAREVPWMQFIPSMVKTHPNPGRRAGEILEHARKLQAQYPNATYIGRENLQKRIPLSRQRFR